MTEKHLKPVNGTKDETDSVGPIRPGSALHEILMVVAKRVLERLRAEQCANEDKCRRPRDEND